MSQYIIVETRDPFESTDTEFTHTMAQSLVAKGHEVVLYLVQNGVLPARRGTKYTSLLENLTKNKVAVWADDFSLKERAIAPSDLSSGVLSISIEKFVQTVMENNPKTIWH